MILNVGSARIDYEIVGEGTPVLMLHGFPLDREIMKGCMEPIFDSRDGYSRIYLDLPGMGKSPSPEGNWTSDDMLGAVIFLIHELLPERRVILVGESYGAYLARGLVNKLFDRIAGICMICPLIIPQDELRDLPQAERDPVPYNQLSSEEERISSFAQTFDKNVGERYRLEVEEALARADEDFVEDLRNNGYPLGFDPDELEKPFSAPSLFICGRQDRIVGYRDAWAIIDRYPRATFALIDGAGHYLQVEREDAFRSLLHEWLDRLESI